MPRYCLLGHVDPSRLDEYREAHSAVWPELLEALRDAGWRNYSLFLRDDGLLIGYAEADDLAIAQERVARTEVNARWQAAMSELFQSEGAPDEAWEIIPEVFNLEDQLRQAGRAIPSQQCGLCCEYPAQSSTLLRSSQIAATAGAARRRSRCR